MKHKTCVSIAENTPKQMLDVLSAALRRSDYAEIRLDFLKPKQVPQALEMLGRNLNRCVCTLRPVSEGGKFFGNEKERVSILKLIGEYGPFLLDIEYQTLRKNKDLLRYIKKTKTNILVSWHDFNKTPTLSFLIKKLNQMRKYSNYIKIVTTAKSADDSSRVLSLYGKMPPSLSSSKTKLIAFSMGNYGKMSRILCLYLGSPYTYVSLGKPVAPGQFSVNEIKSVIGN